MNVHKKIGSKERFLEMFQNVNKVVVKEQKEEPKKIIKEGYNEWGLKVTKSRLDEAFGSNKRENLINYFTNMYFKDQNVLNSPIHKQELAQYFNYTPENFAQMSDEELQMLWDKTAQLGESFDNPKAIDTQYTDKTYDNKQNGKLDGGMSDYPVKGVKPQTDAPELKGLKGDRIPLVKEDIDLNTLQPDQRLAYDELMSSNLSMLSNADMQYYADKIGVDVEELMSMANNAGQEEFDQKHGFLGTKIPDVDDETPQTDPMQWKLFPEGELEAIPGAEYDQDGTRIATPAGGTPAYPKNESDEEVPDGEFGDAELTDEPEEMNVDLGGEMDATEEIPSPDGEFGGEDKIEGGLADDASASDFDPQQILKGMEVEMEHTDDPKVALEIAMDHLEEIPDYYDHLADMEAQATGEEPASAEDAVDVMGDGPDSEPADDDSPSEDEVLWGRMDTIGDIGDEEVDGYEPKGLGEVSPIVYDRPYDGMDDDAQNRMRNRQGIRVNKFSEPPIDDEFPGEDDAMSHIGSHDVEDIPDTDIRPDQIYDDPRELGKV